MVRPIDFYYSPTPNGWKISIMLEECELTYNTILMDLNKGDQFKPDFLRISPNNRMPAIIDYETKEPTTIFESGAILLYLADKTKITSLSPDSLKEQKNSGLDNCTKEEFDEFSKLNNTYKKFGFPFILAIKGKTKIEILNNFRKRISFDSETEFKEALKQVKKIALLRLEDLKNKDI